MIIRMTISQYARLHHLFGFRHTVNVKGKELANQLRRIYDVHQTK